MGKVSAGLFVTLDAVAEAPERWNPLYFDGEMAHELASAMSAADAFLLGRWICRSTRSWSSTSSG
jgi:hypothetical protein